MTTSVTLNLRRIWVESHAKDLLALNILGKCELTLLSIWTIVGAKIWFTQHEHYGPSMYWCRLNYSFSLSLTLALCLPSKLMRYFIHTSTDNTEKLKMYKQPVSEKFPEVSRLTIFRFLYAYALLFKSVHFILKSKRQFTLATE